MGSGTGILTEMLLANGNRVRAVEPNRAMAAEAARRLGGHPLFRDVDGRAEATGLLAGEVDLVVAGQAFHWFDAARSREMATVKVRYKDPDGDASRLSSYTVHASQGVAPERAADFDFATAVACFGMLLRESEGRGSADWAMVHDLSTRGLAWDPGGWRAQFLTLASKAESIPIRTSTTPD